MRKILLLCLMVLSTSVIQAQDTADKMPIESKTFEGTIYYKTKISGNGIDYKQAERQAKKQYILKYGKGFIRYEENDQEGIYTLYDLRTGEALRINTNNQTYAQLKEGAGTFMDMDSTYLKDINRVDTLMNYHCDRFKSTTKKGRYEVSNLYWVTPELQINPTVYNQIDQRLVNYQHEDKLRNRGIMLKTISRYKLKGKTAYSTRLYADKIDETPVSPEQFIHPEELGYTERRKLK